MTQKFIIGTRASRLALWQAEEVARQLRALGVNAELKKITTKGDVIQDRSLAEIGGKGLFLKELEDELLSGNIRIAVHSLKDVPFELPERLVIGAILPRGEARDAFVGRDGKNISDLAPGAVIGTASLRRLVQVQKKFPQLKFHTLRGNVETRLKKLDDGEFDGIILAWAGLERLGLIHRITHGLEIVSAVGQGAIGIECRDNDLEALELIKALHDPLTGQCVTLEREFLRRVSGNCQTPLGCHVIIDPKDKKCFLMRYFWSRPDGSDFTLGDVHGPWTDGPKIVQELSLPV